MKRGKLTALRFERFGPAFGGSNSLGEATLTVETWGT